MHSTGRKKGVKNRIVCAAPVESVAIEGRKGDNHHPASRVREVKVGDDHQTHTTALYFIAHHFRVLRCTPCTNAIASPRRAETRKSTCHKSTAVPRVTAQLSDRRFCCTMPIQRFHHDPTPSSRQSSSSFREVVSSLVARTLPRMSLSLESSTKKLNDFSTSSRLAHGDQCRKRS